MQEETKLRQLVRIINADIAGNRNVFIGLRKIKGISYAFSNAICNLTDIDKNRRIGSLTDEEIKRIEEIIRKYEKIPVWLRNRRKDYETGEDQHLITASLDLRKELDIKHMKNIKSYRGMRHSFGLPVRGQRTKAHFRKGAAIGVKKKAAKIADARAGKDEKGKEAKGKETKPKEKAKK